MSTTATPVTPATTPTVAAPAAAPATAPATTVVHGIHPGWVVLILVILGVCGYYIHTAMMGYQKALDTAESAQKQYNAQAVQDQQQFTNDKQVITALSQQQTKIVAVETQANTQAQQAMQTVQQQATTPEVVANSTKYLGVTPSAETDGYLGYKPTDVQTFIETKIEHDEYATDLSDTKQVLADEQQKNAKLTTDLTTSEALTADANKTITAYKNVAVKSKKAKLFGALKSAGRDIGLAVVAYEAGKHI